MHKWFKLSKYISPRTMELLVLNAYSNVNCLPVLTPLRLVQRHHSARICVFRNLPHYVNLVVVVVVVSSYVSSFLMPNSVVMSLGVHLEVMSALKRGNLCPMRKFDNSTISWEWCEVGFQLVLFTNRKSHTDF